ncbi:MAG: DUF3179 domain-containing (seleno)protein [Tepidiformaceae bacterium]
MGVRRFRILLFVSAATWLLAACSGGSPDPAPPTSPEGTLTAVTAAPQPGDSGRFPDWPLTDFSRATIDLHEVIRGCPAADCIPALDAEGTVAIPSSRGGRATFAPVSTVDLEPQMPVVVVRVAAEVRGYPLHVLTWHEIVNDRLGGVPIAVTFCPLCNTAVTFDRRVDGRTLDFGVSGNLRNSDLIMWDRQTHSWWQQATGEGIVGEFAGTLLDIVSTSMISFGDFAREFPDATVLTADTGFERDYGINPYAGYDSPGTRPFLFDGKIDPRLDGLERVATIEHNGDLLAVPFKELAQAGAANVVVGGREFVVLWSSGTASALGASNIASAADIGAATVYRASVDGLVLAFRAVGDGAFFDQETGSTWTITGRAVSGTLAGAQLEPAIHTTQFWFAWAAFHRDTRIWEPSS